MTSLPLGLYYLFVYFEVSHELAQFGIDTPAAELLAQLAG